jgi:hypothetical protein
VAPAAGTPALVGDGLPIKALSVGRNLHDEDGAFARHYSLGEAGAALVRPDGYLTRWLHDRGDSPEQTERMRSAFVHDAIVSMEPDADSRALGAAVTVALCGSWDHDPPCPLAPHHSRAERVGDVVQIRILFAAEPDREAQVRRRIETALASGRLSKSDGGTTYWQLRSSQPGEVSANEAEHGEQLICNWPCHHLPLW